MYSTRRGGDWRASPVLLKAWQRLQLPSCATARGHAIVKTALPPVSAACMHRLAVLHVGEWRWRGQRARVQVQKHCGSGTTAAVPAETLQSQRHASNTLQTQVYSALRRQQHHATQQNTCKRQRHPSCTPTQSGLHQLSPVAAAAAAAAIAGAIAAAVAAAEWRAHCGRG